MGASRGRAVKRVVVAVAVVACTIGLGRMLGRAGSHPVPPSERAEATAHKDTAERRDAAAPAQAATLHALGDIAPGMPLGSYQISAVSEPIDGAVLVRANSSAGEIVYEVRLLTARPLPPAKTRLYSVYYRGIDGGADVLAGASALADLLGRAPPDTPPLPGLTKYPPPFKPFD